MTRPVRKLIMALTAMARRKPIAPAPMPESIKALTRARPCFRPEQPRTLVWPLRAADGRTFAEGKADRDMAA